MGFMNKLKFLKNLYSADKLDRMVKCHIVMEVDSISDDFLKILKLRFPKLPESYLNFLKAYGDLEIAWFKFYGEGGKYSVSLFEMLNLWEEYDIYHFEKNGFCLIGCDPGGDLYCLNEQGEVIMFDSVNVEEPPKFITDSFDTFMNEHVLGKNYPEFAREDNEFYQFLKEQGWA
jgi:hypothetical protein